MYQRVSVLILTSLSLLLLTRCQLMKLKAIRANIHSLWLSLTLKTYKAKIKLDFHFIHTCHSGVYITEVCGKFYCCANNGKMRRIRFFSPIYIILCVCFPEMFLMLCSTGRQQAHARRRRYSHAPQSQAENRRGVERRFENYAIMNDVRLVRTVFLCVGEREMYNVCSTGSTTDTLHSTSSTAMIPMIHFLCNTRERGCT